MGRDETGRDETARDEMGPDEMGRDETARDETGCHETGPDEMGRDEAARDETGRDESPRNVAPRVTEGNKSPKLLIVVVSFLAVESPTAPVRISAKLFPQRPAPPSTRCGCAASRKALSALEPRWHVPRRSLRIRLAVHAWRNHMLRRSGMMVTMDHVVK
jgi:hypothetical protein